MARILLKIDSGNDIGSKFKTVTFCSNAPASPDTRTKVIHTKIKRGSAPELGQRVLLLQELPVQPNGEISLGALDVVGIDQVDPAGVADHALLESRDEFGPQRHIGLLGKSEDRGRTAGWA